MGPYKNKNKMSRKIDQHEVIAENSTRNIKLCALTVCDFQNLKTVWNGLGCGRALGTV